MKNKKKEKIDKFLKKKCEKYAAMFDDEKEIEISDFEIKQMLEEIKFIEQTRRNT